MILPHLILLSAALQGQSSQTQRQGNYYIIHGSYKDEYFPTFLSEEQKTKFETELNEVKAFKQYNHLVSKIPSSKPHAMFVMRNGSLTSIFFENAKTGNMADGAEMKIVANYNDGVKQTQYLAIAPGMPGITSNFRAHFLNEKSYITTFDIIVRLKDASWVKVANWKPTGPQDKFGSGRL